MTLAWDRLARRYSVLPVVHLDLDRPRMKFPYRGPGKGGRAKALKVFACRQSCHGMLLVLVE